MAEKKLAKTAHDREREARRYKHLCRICVNEMKVVKYCGNSPVHGLYWTCGTCGFAESTSKREKIAVVTNEGIKPCTFVEAQRICLKS